MTATRQPLSALNVGTPIVVCVEGERGRMIHDLFVVRQPLTPAVLAEYVRQHPERWEWDLEDAPLTAWLQRGGYIVPIAYTKLHVNRHNTRSQTWTVEDVNAEEAPWPSLGDREWEAPEGPAAAALESKDGSTDILIL